MSDLLSLPLSRLEQPLKIRSRLLDAELWIVPPGHEDRDFDAPAYTLEECRDLLLLELSAEELQAAHLVKKLFDGDLALPEDTDHLRRLYTRQLNKYRQLERRLNGRVTEADEIALLQAARQLSRLLAHAETPEGK